MRNGENAKKVYIDNEKVKADLTELTSTKAETKFKAKLKESKTPIIHPCKECRYTSKKTKCLKRHMQIEHNKNTKKG